MVVAVKQILRPYQGATVDKSIDHVKAYVGGTGPRMLLIAAPTGSGKGTMQLAVRARLGGAKNVIIMTPSLEVVRGYLERLGYEIPKSAAAMTKIAEEERIYTPVTLRNRAFSTDLSDPVLIIVDEVHHFIGANAVYEQIDALFADVPLIGYTATPFRATPKSTKALRDHWGVTWVALTWKKAVEDGYAAQPKFRVVPLIDDDKITIRSGEFRVEKGEDGRGQLKLESLVDLIARNGVETPSIIALPSTELVHATSQIAMQRHGLELIPVTQATKFSERTVAYEKCRQGKAAIVQIAVLTEGVDLPWLGRLFDAKPTMSPVAWIQLVGRFTRPREDDSRAEVVVCCRNLERHGYLFEGLLPPAALGVAQEAFGGPSERAASRSIGLEQLSKFKAIELPLICQGRQLRTTMYMLVTNDGHKTIEYAVIHRPMRHDPIIATRNFVPNGLQTKWGRWEKATLPDEFDGFATNPRRYNCSPKQEAWWLKASKYYGLDPDAKVNARQFQAMPVLKDLRETLV